MIALFAVLLSLSSVPTLHECTAETWWYCPTINLSPYKDGLFYRFHYLWKLGDDSGVVDDLKKVPVGAIWKRFAI
ncbi:MAG: hypothetical protein LWW87_06950 [Geobacteraceae bacterium]|nr:hypothetical protein [Geobacteraceae bacterium]